MIHIKNSFLHPLRITAFGELSLANPSISTETSFPQPNMFQGQLKTYQLKVSNVTVLVSVSYLLIVIFTLAGIIN